jgi:hypothetical protein
MPTKPGLDITTEAGTGNEILTTEAGIYLITESTDILLIGQLLG